MIKKIIFVRLAQVAMAFAAIIFFAWLGWQNLVPTGSFTTVWRPGKTSAFIDRLLPDSRVFSSKLIVDDPVFFFTHPHRRFDTVEVEIQFLNHGANIIEFGGLASSDPEVYTLLPLKNRLLDDPPWSQINSNGLTLFQRRQNFASVADFLKHSPTISQIATYQAAFAAPSPAPMLLKTPREVRLDLRGTHEMKFVTDDGLLALEMSYTQDASNTKPLTIILSGQDGNVIASRVYALEAGKTNTRTIRFDIPNLTEGVYKLSWQASDGIVWNSLTSRLTQVVFLNHFSTAGPLRVSVDAPEFSLKTSTAEGLQTVSLSGRSIEITEPGAPVSVRSTVAGEMLDIARGPLVMDGIGWYAVEPFVLFRPDAIRLQATTDFDAQGIDYVLAKYAPPSVDGEWSVARISFDASKLLMQNGTWKFVFSIPKIKEQNASVEIGEIKMTWRRKSLW